MNTHFESQFVTTIPANLEPNVLYVSMEFGTVIHLCACGCGNKVITPLSPKDWKLSYDGEVISLVPSIGNWSFPCKSHYWIRSSRVQWDARWSDEEIARNRQSVHEEALERAPEATAPAKRTPFQNLLAWLKGLFR